MAKKKLIRIEEPVSKSGQQEHYRGKLGLVFCGDCGSVYYKKSWHHNLRHYKNLRENLPIKFSTCPACPDTFGRYQRPAVFPIKTTIIPKSILFKNRQNLARGVLKNKIFQRCGACQMIKNKQFEGEIIIKNPPAKNFRELVNLVKAFSRRAYERDPMDRLIEIKNADGELRITATENHLAVKLAKKIQQVFKPSTTKISYSSSPSDVVYIKLEFRS